jgi:hypothetical protein
MLPAVQREGRVAPPNIFSPHAPTFGDVWLGTLLPERLENFFPFDPIQGLPVHDGASERLRCGSASHCGRT